VKLSREVKNMGKKVLLVGMVMSIVIPLILFYNDVTTIAREVYGSISIPYLAEILGALHILFWNDYSNIYIAIWIGIGLVIGGLIRKSGKGFVYGFYLSGLMMIILYAVTLLIKGETYLPHTALGEFYFIVYFLYPLVANGLLCGFGGLIAGRITKKGALGLSKEMIEQLIQKAERICPKCGAKIESSAIFCSVCGASLESLDENKIDKLEAVEAPHS